MALLLTNWASRRTHTGRAFSIMLHPRHWERGLGTVRVLTPHAVEEQFNAARRVRQPGADRRSIAEVMAAAQKAIADYRKDFDAYLTEHALELQPGRLVAHVSADARRLGKTNLVVEDGDTLCCSCSVDAASNEQCHRAWAARHLRAAGWTVSLDGVVLLP